MHIHTLVHVCEDERGGAFAPLEYSYRCRHRCRVFGTVIDGLLLLLYTGADHIFHLSTAGLRNVSAGWRVAVKGGKGVIDVIIIENRRHVNTLRVNGFPLRLRRS